MNIYDLSDRFPKLSNDVKHLVSKVQGVITQFEEKEKIEKDKLREVKQYKKKPTNSQRFSQACVEQEINEKLIVLESNKGNNFTGDIYHLYRALQDDERFASYRIIWIYSSRYDLEQLKNNLNVDERTDFISRADQQYQLALACAKYYFNDSVAPLWYVKREGQVYINVWHSTPFSYMGYDRGFMPHNPFPIRSWLSNYLMSDYIIVNDEQAAKVLLRSYKLEGLFEGKLLIGGSPRNNVATSLQEIEYKLSLTQLNYDCDKKTILWSVVNDVLDEDSYNRFVNEVKEVIHHVGQKYNILLSLPESLSDKLIENDVFTQYIIPQWMDINELLLITNKVISSYSTLFYDLVNTDLPICFYDFNDNALENHYISREQLASATKYTIQDVLQFIDTEKDGVNEPLPSTVNQSYLNMIINGEYSDEIQVKALNNEKTKIVFYAGDLKNNFITYRFFNILKLIDFNKVDVTVLLSSNDVNEESYENLRRISSCIRPIFYQGYASFTQEETNHDLIIRREGLTRDNYHLYPQQAYRRETRRLFGDSQFDFAIDFKGDNFYWSRYIAECNSHQHLLMQQYDIEYQYNQAIKKKAEHRQASLHSMMTYYQKYDQVIMIKKNYDKNKLFARQYIAPEFTSYYDVSDINPVLPFPYYEEVCRDIELEKMSHRIMIDNEGTYTVYPNHYDLTNGKEVVLTQENNIAAVARFVDEHITYLKLIVDNMYIGWIKESDVEVTTARVIDSRDVSYYAILKNTKGHIIYNEPYNISDNTYMIGRANMLNGVIVYVDQEVLTSRATYCRIFIDDELIGYVDQRALNEVKINQTKLSYNHRINKEKIETRLLYSESLDEKATIKDVSTTKLYTKSYGSYRCQEEELTANRLAPRPLHVTWKVETKLGTSYEITDDFNQHAWIREEDLNFIIKE